MAWLARSIAATLSSPRGEPDPDADDDPESEPASAGSGAAGPGEEFSPRGRGPNRGPGVEAEEPEQPGTPSRGVKDDISELTETLTRRLWGVASFLAPPPEAPTPRAGAEAPAEGEEEEEEDAGDGTADGEEAALLSPRIAGIRSDLAEFGGRVRSGFSMLQNNLAVAEISKIASSILPFGQGEADEGEPVPGVTEEVVVFVRHISTRPETWLDFPLFISERYADDFELSDAQYVHALSIEHLIPGLSDLKIQICSTDMTEACFWKIYFVLLHSKLNKQDAELLSTPQILEAREQLLQSLQAQNKRGSKFPDESSEDVNVSPASAEEKVIQPSSIQDKAGTSENVNVSGAPTEEKVIQPSSIQDKAGTSDISSFEEPTSDIMPEIESEKFPILATEVEIVDKSVIEEELAVKDESKTPPVQSKLRFEADEDDVDEWPDDDDPAGEVGAASNRTSLGREEDVSFSDLEDDEDDDVNKRHGQ